MALRSDVDLGGSWRALASAGVSGDVGVRSIALEAGPSPRTLAGVTFPDKLEGLLVGFDLPAGFSGKLPAGLGFSVVLLEHAPHPSRSTWLSLTRAAGANLDLFQAMAEDLLLVMGRHGNQGEVALSQRFLARVRTWQRFMSDPRDERLSDEEELGLTGELALIGLALDHGADPLGLVQGWQGPYDGVHDFSVSAGAAEVKTTLSAASFPAKISSLDQLDDAQTAPIFLVAFRCSIEATAPTLPVRIEALRAVIATSPPALRAFERAILHAGYLDDHAELYSRRIETGPARTFPVETLPRLRRTDLPTAIRAAVYELDLDLVDATLVPLSEVLRSLELVTE